MGDEREKPAEIDDRDATARADVAPQDTGPEDTGTASGAKPAEVTLPGAGTEAGDRLRAAHAAFERGDYAAVRVDTKKLLESDDADVARAALALRRRVQVDPAQVGVVLSCFLFFLFIVWQYVL